LKKTWYERFRGDIFGTAKAGLLYYSYGAFGARKLCLHVSGGILVDNGTQNAAKTASWAGLVAPIAPRKSSTVSLLNECQSRPREELAFRLNH